MDHCNQYLPHEAVCERYVFLSDAEEEWDSELEYRDVTADSYIESEGEDFYFEKENIADTELFSDAEGDDYDIDECCSDGDDHSFDAVEYVYFGKGMEFDGSQWMWGKDEDLWLVLYR